MEAFFFPLSKGAAALNSQPTRFRQTRCVCSDLGSHGNPGIVLPFDMPKSKIPLWQLKAVLLL